jgi:hypothetical protein
MELVTVTTVILSATGFVPKAMYLQESEIPEPERRHV